MEYTINLVCTDDKSIKEVQDLLCQTFPKAVKKFSFNYLKWQYDENPLGKIVGFNAYSGEELAAHYVTMPIEMELFGSRRKGLLSLNTATHPNHRGKRLFTILAGQTYSYAAEHGYDYVIGVANANSTHGFLKNLGFYLISPLDVKIGIGSSIYCGIDKPCSRVWDEQTLRWRLRNPSARYFSSQNVVYGLRSVPGVKLCIGGNLGQDMAEIDLREPSIFRPVNLYIGLGANLDNGNYFNLPKFVKHSPFNLIFKDLKGDIPKITSEDIFFQLIDFDVA